MNVWGRHRDSHLNRRVIPLLIAAGACCLTTQGALAQKRVAKAIYGVGVVGNCCTHGAAICRMFQGRKDTRVLAAYEQDPRRAKELAEVLGAPLADSYDAVIRHVGVDIVAITCDPADKAAMIEKAAAAGKSIFLNKPPCDSLNGAQRIVRAVKQHQIWLVHDIPMVRFVPVYARLLKDVRAGRYGKVMGYHHLFGMNFDPAFDLAAVWPERLDPAEKAGGGEMTNMGCYAIDFAVGLFGQPQAVTAKWRKEWEAYREADVEHFGQIVLDYGEFFALLEVGKQQLAGQRRHSNQLTINFEHCTLLIDATAKLAAVNHIPVEWEEFSRGATAPSSVDQLLAAVRDGTPPTSGVDNIVPATEVLMAAYQSIMQNRTVPLPLPSGQNPLVGKKLTPVVQPAP